MTRLPVVWLGLWVGAIILVSALQPPDVEAVVRKMFLWGWVVLWCIVVGIWYAYLRSGKPRDLAQLYSRLALTPPSPRALSLAGGGRLSLAYLMFMVVVVAFVTVLFGIDGESAQRPLLLAMIGLVAVVGLPLTVLALRSSKAGMEELLAPLGLEATQAPKLGFAHGLASGRTRLTLEGAQVFAGMRHGRAVSIVQRPDLAITLVEPSELTPWLDPPIAPGTAEEMAGLTGEPASSFTDVTVTTAPEGVRVERRGSDAAKRFLLDLALAEAVAGS